MKKQWYDAWASDESWSWTLCWLLKSHRSFILRHGYEYGTGVMGFAPASDGLMSKETVECAPEPIMFLSVYVVSSGST